MANGQGQEQHQVPTGDGQEAEFSLRCHPFTRHFSQATHALLTSCTRQEVLSYFGHFEPKTQEFLYKVYALVVAQIRENVMVRYAPVDKIVVSRKLPLTQTEFSSICKEHQVLEVLDRVSERSPMCDIEAGDHPHPKEMVKEAVKRKMQEVEAMRRKLEQTKEENNLLKAQLEVVRVRMDEAHDQSSVRDLVEKIRSVNLKLMK